MAKVRIGTALIVGRRHVFDGGRNRSPFVRLGLSTSPSPRASGLFFSFCLSAGLKRRPGQAMPQVVGRPTERPSAVSGVCSVACGSRCWFVSWFNELSPLAINFGSGGCPAHAAFGAVLRRQAGRFRRADKQENQAELCRRHKATCANGGSGKRKDRAAWSRCRHVHCEFWRRSRKSTQSDQEVPGTCGFWRSAPAASRTVQTRGQTRESSRAMPQA